MYKILIVEDDRVIADKMKEHLEKWDYEVACVQDFKRVQEEYTAFDPQLVIMDIILPFYNGFHWCTPDSSDLQCADPVFIIRK